MATITPTTMKTSDLINLATSPGALKAALTDTPSPGSSPVSPDVNTYNTNRQAILDEIDRRIPIPA